MFPKSVASLIEKGHAIQSLELPAALFKYQYSSRVNSLPVYILDNGTKILKYLSIKSSLFNKNQIATYVFYFVRKTFQQDALKTSRRVQRPEIKGQFWEPGRKTLKVASILIGGNGDHWKNFMALLELLAMSQLLPNELLHVNRVQLSTRIWRMKSPISGRGK